MFLTNQQLRQAARIYCVKHDLPSGSTVFVMWATVQAGLVILV